MPEKKNECETEKVMTEQSFGNEINIQEVMAITEMAVFSYIAICRYKLPIENCHLRK